eukprot:1261631-Pleurochrysis_carterae.AAC.1
MSRRVAVTPDAMRRRACRLRAEVTSPNGVSCCLLCRKVILGVAHARRDAADGAAQRAVDGPEEGSVALKHAGHMEQNILN